MSRCDRRKPPLLLCAEISDAMVYCRRLAAHFTRRLCSRTLESVGSSMLISTPMMPMTTSNSMRVNATRRCRLRRWMLVRIGAPPEKIGSEYEIKERSAGINDQQQRRCRVLVENEREWTALDNISDKLLAGRIVRDKQNAS